MNFEGRAKPQKKSVLFVPLLANHMYFKLLLSKLFEMILMTTWQNHRNYIEIDFKILRHEIKWTTYRSRQLYSFLVEKCFFHSVRFWKSQRASLLNDYQVISKGSYVSLNSTIDLSCPSKGVSVFFLEMISLTKQ